MMLAMQMLNSGFGSQPERVLEQQYRDLPAPQAQALFSQYKNSRRKELETIIDRIAASQGEGFTTGTAAKEMVLQDIVPFYGAITRVLGTNKFLPDNVEIGILRRGLPGEVRQVLREWWVGATHEERKNYLESLEKQWNDVRKGTNSKFYTRYLVIENLMGAFPDTLLDKSDPNDSFDRVLGNLDTLLGGIVAVGTIAKRGTSIFDVFKSNNSNMTRQAAAAIGNKKALEDLDASIRAGSGDSGITASESALSDMPKPHAMVEDLEVVPDSVKDVIVQGERIGKHVLDDSESLTGLGLNKADKDDATVKFVKELSDSDNVHPMSKMTTTEDLPSGTGIRVSVVMGKEPGAGWNDLGEMLDTIKELDPTNMQNFEILRRGPDGTLVPAGVSPAELKAFADDGVLPVMLEQLLDPMNQTSRIFKGKKLSKVSQQDLEDALNYELVGRDTQDWTNIRRELNRRGSEAPPADALLAYKGEDFYFRRTQERYWMPIDKIGLSGSWTHTWVPTWLRWATTNNSKLSGFYTPFRMAHGIETGLKEKLMLIYQPFYKLSTKSQQTVQTVLLHTEEYAKDMFEATGVARGPRYAEILDEFPDITEAQLRGYAAIRTGLDVQYEMFNRRLYRELLNQGRVTARFTDPNAPNFHGTRLTSVEEGKFYNPKTRQIEDLTKQDLEDLAADGGGIMELDFPIDTPSGGSYTRLIVRKGEAEFGPLSKSPLNYYEGYSMRFYADPVIIEKVVRNPTINGRKQYTDSEWAALTPAQRDASVSVQAIRTAGSSSEARRWLDRGGNRKKNINGEYIDKRTPGVTWRYRLGKNIAQTEGTLYQQEALYREGRMFWDTRAMERLPDVNGNDAKVWDTAHSLHKGTAMAVRQTTQEDLFRTMKEGFVNEFSDLPIFSERPMKLRMDDLGEIKKDLNDGILNARDPDLKQRYRQAKEVVNYMRTQLGTDDFLVPKLRSWTVGLAEWMGTAPRPLSGKSVIDPVERFITRVGVSADPFSFMRRVAYNAFMVLRPGRQALLQSLQVTMLMGLDPLYIGSGRIVFDALSLRRGVASLRKSGFSDGWNDKTIAKEMGLTRKEYKRLVEEFDRTGFLGSVDEHLYNARAGRSQNARLDSQSGPMGRFAYDARVQGRGFMDKLAKGFEWGEQNNLTFSYLVAVRRAKKRLKVKDLTKFSKKDWEDIMMDTDGLSMAMTKPNKMGYQSGATGVTLQFLSFQHRAFLTLAGLNPSLSAKDTAKVWAGIYTLWGTNMFGAEDFVREQLSNIGLTNDAGMEVLPGITMQDLLSAGIIESGYNAISKAVGGTELNLSSLAPGAQVVDIYMQMYESFIEKPVGMAVLGPSQNQASGVLMGLSFLEKVWDSERLSPAKKFLGMADMVMREALPGRNDANKARIAYQLGVWVDKDGDSLGIQSTLDALIARGIFGIRPEEEGTIYQMRKVHWENQDNIDNMVKALQPVIKQLTLEWRDSPDIRGKILERAEVVWSAIDDAPEGIKQEIYERVMKEPDFSGVSPLQTIAEATAQGTSNVRKMVPLINQMNSWTPEQKRQMSQFVNEIADGYVETDEQFGQLLEPELE